MVGHEAQHLLTVKEVAQMMRVSSMTVYRIVKNGELPAYRIERQIRIAERDVHRYLAEHYNETG